MHQPYHDILDAMTELIRAEHDLFQDERSSYPTGCASSGPDGRRLHDTCTCVARPLWWDENGVPRFQAHSPMLCPAIGADEVALILVACQACGKEFPVQMSWDWMGVLGAAARAGITVDVVATMKERVVKRSLAYQIAGRGPHYGDPPWHPNCAAGCTMNVWDLRVLEFWRRGARSTGDAPDTHGHYVRIRDLEIALPDLTSADRVGPS